MSVDEVLIGSVALFFLLVVFLALVARTRPRPKCTRCGARLPRGTAGSLCPTCQAAAQPPQPPPQPYQAAPSSFAKQPPVATQGTTPRLVAARGPLVPQQFSLPTQGLSIGRHQDNDIVLPDELMVSRFHAVLAQENGQWVLYDRDSANGTWVNEQRVFRHILVPGDRIQIWQSQFVFAVSDTPPPSPPSPQTEISARPTVHVVGEEFCNYYLESLIGRGGMSEVFRARDANGRTVAIKILQQTDPYLVSKFVQEGNEIGPLLRGHANVVYVHEFGHSPDNRLYIVMEYVDAPSLRKALHGPLGEGETLRIMVQVCSALAFAHQNNVVHRDIKPENILVGTEGTVKVLDFGIAKLTSASTVTRDKIVGTPEYISPEQARGDPVQPASDVYSLGIVLYELLVGSVPFPRARNVEAYIAAIEVVRQHLKSEPEPMRKRNPAVHVAPKLERVVMRALKKNVKDRYPTARELGDALGYREGVNHVLQPIQHPAPDRPTPGSLVILQGPRQGERIPVNETAAIGRFELGSNNTTISRQHANIFFRAGSYWLEDRSKNGTWVNNVRVYGEVPLPPGAIIAIGDNILKLESSPG